MMQIGKITMVLVALQSAMLCQSAVPETYGTTVEDIIAQEREALDVDIKLAHDIHRHFMGLLQYKLKSNLLEEYTLAAHLFESIESVRVDLIDEVLANSENHSVGRLKHALYKVHRKAYALITGDLEKLVLVGKKLFDFGAYEIINMENRLHQRFHQYDDARFASNEIHSS